MVEINKRIESSLGLHAKRIAFATHQRTFGSSISRKIIGDRITNTRHLSVLNDSSFYDEISALDAPSSSIDVLSAVDVPSSSIDVFPSFSTPGIETIQTFEPVVNYPALLSCLVIAVTFGLLQLRINMVQTAAERRKNSLVTLRKAKALQLSSSRAGLEHVSDALAAYEKALIDEENLRTLIPGVRIVAPNNPARSEEDVSAAKQYLGWDLTDGDNVDERSQINQPVQRASKNIVETTIRDNGDMTLGQKLTLGIVGVSQIFLLCLFSFDPMTSSDIFSDMAGSPMSIIASSSL
eukprot:CAMPEP_0194382436 /NCGR_PEP_ID=MMETSP0174-20130528/60515_1 /TAXON_ID=216777 /ORGANISM="Proboscia alata, Strain PI-D3" /LENGTH=293 /DNA_ID=CAMNT_0039167747 /DNA_START=89 /DNA_END=973 /DNA_ORIENTATION=-